MDAKKLETLLDHLEVSIDASHRLNRDLINKPKLYFKDHLLWPVFIRSVLLRTSLSLSTAAVARSAKEGVMGSVIRLVIRSLIPIGFVLVSFVPGTPAVAASPQIIVDSGKVTVETDKTGVKTATVTLLNLSDSPVHLPKATIVGHPDNGVDITGASDLQAASRTALTLIFRDPLPIDPKLALEFGSGTTFSTYTLPLSLPDPALDWALIG